MSTCGCRRLLLRATRFFAEKPLKVPDIGRESSDNTPSSMTQPSWLFFPGLLGSSNSSSSKPLKVLLGVFRLARMEWPVPSRPVPPGMPDDRLASNNCSSRNRVYDEAWIAEVWGMYMYMYVLS